MRVRRVVTVAVGVTLLASVIAPAARATTGATTNATTSAAATASAASPGPTTPANASRKLPAVIGSPTPAGWESVTLQLAANDPQALTALSRAQGISATARRDVLNHALASPEHQATVEHVLTSNGLTVTDVSAFAITAMGPTQTVRALFPNTASTQQHTTRASLRQTTTSRSPTVRVPTELNGLVTVAISSAYTGLTFHPLNTPLTAPLAAPLAAPLTAPLALPRAAPACNQCIDGTKARRFYDVPESSATTDGAGITIATLQFSGWDSGSLTDFATNYGLPDPVVSIQYQGISVGGADPTLASGGGETEVALDQEALLLTAPKANQVAYFAPNSIAGEIAALNQIANDATNNTAGLHYTALSISWGLCEPDEALYGAQAIGAVSAALATVNAAGVTIFASSGDSGAYDCSTSISPYNVAAVDYPASDPSVIGVGGLTSTGPTPTEAAWWSPVAGAPSNAFQGNGSGGGVSSFWLQTSTPWQTSHQANAHRLVPDIALNGDPNTGQQIFIRSNSDPTGSWLTVGGTSLAAPLAAATLTDLQIANGPTTSYGLGFISPNLYDAPASSFRDITTGSNGVYDTGPGYDTVTGLGAPLWSHLASSLFGAPTITAPAVTNNRVIPISVTTPVGMQYVGYQAGFGSRPTTCNPNDGTAQPPTDLTVTADGSYSVWILGYTTNGYTGFTTTKCYLSETVVRVDTTAPTAAIASPTSAFASSSTIPVRWTAADVNGSGVTSIDVQVTRAASPGGTPSLLTTWHATSTAQSVSITNPLSSSTYCFKARATDAVGNTGEWSPPTCTTTPRDDLALAAKTTGWKRSKAPGFLANTYTSTSTLKASLATSTSLRVSRVGIIATRCPTCGTVAIYVGGTKVGTISLQATTNTSRAFIVLPTFATTRTGIVKFIVTTKGKLVRIDGALLS